MNEIPDQAHASTEQSSAPWIAAIAASLAGVLVGAGTQYWITYQGIEKPKIELETKRIELENKKASIEAHKLALALTPNIVSQCHSQRIDQWTWRVVCNAKNTGLYHADIQINEVKVSLTGDTNEFQYESGSGFNVEFPNKKRSFRASPGSEGDLWLYIKFDRARYKTGIRGNDIAARIALQYDTLISAQNYLVSQFPELADLIKDASMRGTNITLDLPEAQSVNQ